MPSRCHVFRVELNWVRDRDGQREDWVDVIQPLCVNEVAAIRSAIRQSGAVQLAKKSTWVLTGLSVKRLT
jgi:hypothetical protein